MQDEIRTNTVLNGRYEVQRVLGRGGMGAVYLAWDTRHRRQVAVKLARLADPEARAQFRREAGYLQRLSHHSLPRVWDLFSDTQRDFLVMEYIPGDNLEELVRRAGKQPEWLVLRWADELLDALTYLHGQNPPIIHRDIKPSNLKLRQDETLVLVDFGIAKEYLPDVHTQTGATAVSPGFSPLEQYSNRAITDARSDLYSLGATVYFLLTGVTLPSAPDRASGDKALAPIRQVAPNVQPATQMLVQRAVQIHREERWTSAADMRSAVTDAASLLTAEDPKAAAATKKALKRTAKAQAAQPAKPVKPRTARRSPAEAVKWLVIGVVALALIVSLVGLADSLEVFDFSSTPQVQLSIQTPTSATPVATSTPAQVTALVGAADTPTRVAPTAMAVSATPAPTNEPAAAAATVAWSTSTPVASRPSPTLRLAAATSTPEPTRATEPTTTPPAPAAVEDAAVTLSRPANNESGSGNVMFEWSLQGGTLGGGQAMELVFWQAGQNSLTEGRPLTSAGAASSADVNVSTLGPGPWYWGVLLVETSPYRRIRLLSEPRTFQVKGEHPGGAPPEPTPALPLPTLPPTPSPTPLP